MDKYINKFIDNKWFIRVIAFILALLLFENVNEENKSVVNVPQDQEAEVIENVPVKSYYDTDNLVVTGIPETVTVTLSGPKSNLQQAITQRGFEVFVDLTKAEIGVQKVPIQIEGISDRLKVSINPDVAEVSIQEKVTQEFSVEAEFDSNILADGYLTEQAVVEPNTVKITGAKDTIEKITYVKATVEAVGPIKDSLTTEAEVLVLDQALNKLNVEVEPKTVSVTVPVKASSKTVPIKLEQKGTLPEGVGIRSISLEKEEATIIAPEEVLNRTESVRVELDLNNITESAELTLPIIISDGIIEVDPKVINITIEVDETEEKNLSSTIEIEGLSEQYEVHFIDPASGQASVTVTGMREEIDPIQASDFHVSINVSNLEVGEHELDLKVEAPANTSWKLAREKVRISITEIEE